MMPPRIETRMADLLEVLDADLRHLESTLSRLNTLRTLLIRRDDLALEQLLDDIRPQAHAHARNEQKRQQLRRELAADLGCRAGDLTLSRLQNELAGRGAAAKGGHSPFSLEAGPAGAARGEKGECSLFAAALAQRQDRLRAVTGQLKREHTLTVLLLRDCTRLNRSLLQAFLGAPGRGGTMYSSTGAEQHQAAAALMSMKL